MDAATVYEILFYLVVGILLLGLGWYWKLKRVSGRQIQNLHEKLTQYQHKDTGLLHRSKIDSQTELLTPWYFIEQADDYFHRTQAPIPEQKEILIIKLIDLEAIESSFGFARADMVIHSVGVQLKSITNDVVSYLGCGVFAVFISRAHAPDLLAQLHKPHAGLRLQYAAGSAYWPTHGRSATKLMRHAQTAMLVSISQYKTWLAYEPEMEPSHLDLEIISLFAEGKVQGLTAVFQPQLNLHSGKIESAEILVRWHHPRLGEVPPMAFIPLLEAAGLTDMVTHMMLETAIRVSAELRQKNLLCAISVNIGVCDLMNSSLVEFIRNTLMKYQGQPHDLRLECAENSMHLDIHKLKKILNELDNPGVAVALDGAGTNGFSLADMIRLPVASVHINRNFVGDMLTNPKHENIVLALLAMARKLEMQILAEGVEDDKTLKRLKSEGCDYAQGYVIARPMDEIRFIEFMHTHGANGFDVS